MFREQLIHAGSRLAALALATTMLLQICCLGSIKSTNELAVSAYAGEASDCHDATPDIPKSPATPNHGCCVQSQSFAALLTTYDIPQLDVTTHKAEIAMPLMALAPNRPIGVASFSSPPSLTVLRI
jgi:hypothetical protein